MLGRYKHQMYVPKPKGHWILTQWKNKTCVSPTEELVNEYLNNPTDAAWDRYEKTYRRILEERFTADRGPFDELARLAREGDVHLGCSCPTKDNPNPAHCHTALAQRFMKEKYPDLEVDFTVVVLKKPARPTTSYRRR